MSAKLDPQRQITFTEPPPPPEPDILPDGQRKRLFELTKRLERLLLSGGVWAMDETFRKCVKLARSLCDELSELPAMPEDTKKSRGGLEEIVAYCQENRWPRSDGEWFFLKCTGSGWKVGGEPIKCWRSVLQAWSRQGYLPSQRLAAARGSYSGGPVPPSKPVSQRELEMEIQKAYE